MFVSTAAYYNVPFVMDRSQGRTSMRRRVPGDTRVLSRNQAHEWRGVLDPVHCSIVCGIGPIDRVSARAYSITIVTLGFMSRGSGVSICIASTTPPFLDP